jgi:hypothetical protein
MSPEQAAGAAVGPPTDVFALGAMLRDVLRAEENPPAELWEVCERAMAVEIAARFPDAVPLGEALLAWLDGARRRAEAQVVLDEARALLAPLAAARAEVEALNRQAEVILAPLPPHAPVEQKLPGWRLEDEAEAKARAVRLMEIELVQKARAALERADDFAEAHALLADLYQQRAAEAEARRDADAAAEYHALLRVHDRGQHAAWMAGTGRFTLHTDPPGGGADAVSDCARRSPACAPTPGAVGGLAGGGCADGAGQLRGAHRGGRPGAGGAAGVHRAAHGLDGGAAGGPAPSSVAAGDTGARRGVCAGRVVHQRRRPAGTRRVCAAAAVGGWVRDDAVPGDASGIHRVLGGSGDGRSSPADALRGSGHDRHTAAPVHPRNKRPARANTQ